MKNYFNFQLSGSKIFPYYFVIFITTFIYSIINAFATQGNGSTTTLKICALLAFVINIVATIIVCYYLFKLCINAISYKNKDLSFNGNYKEYITINIVGILLSIITFGVYTSWYMKRLSDYYARNTSFNNINFKFNGRAFVLFAIFSIAIILIFAITIPLALVMKENPELLDLYQILLFSIMFLLIIPVAYLIYRWDINFTYGNKTIKMEKGGYANGCLFFIGQFLLIMITFGLYYPAAIIRIYRYITSHIEVRNEDNRLCSKLGCDIKVGETYLFIFAQILLSCITLGIYYPWALCAIAKRIMAKTYIEETAEQ